MLTRLVLVHLVIVTDLFNDTGLDHDNFKYLWAAAVRKQVLGGRWSVMDSDVPHGGLFEIDLGRVAETNKMG